MSTLNPPTVAGTATGYPTYMQATIRTSDGRHSLTALLGQNPPSITDGRGGWQEVARTRKPSVIEWLGPSSHKGKVELLLDAWAAGGSVESLMAVVDAIAPPDTQVETPTVYVIGAAPIPETIPWVVQAVTWSDLTRRADGRVARVTVAFDLLQWRQGDVVVRASPAKAAAVRAGTARSKPRTHTVKAGDTLAGIAAKELGSASKWPSIATLNGIRSPNNLRVGQVLKLP